MASIVENRSINGIELPPAGAYAFDKSHTTLGFEARHMLSKVHGRFTEFDGEVTVGDAIEDSSVTVEIKDVVGQHRQRAARRAPAKR